MVASNLLLPLREILPKPLNLVNQKWKINRFYCNGLHLLLFNKTRKMERKRVEDIKEEWKEGRKEKMHKNTNLLQQMQFDRKQIVCAD